ncbi:unnamed protein product, partial [Mesorhabditis belari]|uniref:C-type lectin domain-containing protein n=1 Tax=Mesorhabditis belari TaxID=2138241 RepID=A0AAF3ETQ3_9BILA
MESRAHTLRVIDEAYEAKRRLYKILLFFGLLGVILVGSVTFSMNLNDREGNRHPRNADDDQILLSVCRNRTQRLNEKIKERDDKLLESTRELETQKAQINDNVTNLEKQIANLKTQLENQQKQINSLQSVESTQKAQIASLQEKYKACTNSKNMLPCPIGWQLFGGYCYKFSFQYVKYDQAKEMCEKENSHLVSIHSAVENDYVASFLPKENHFIWIGAELSGSTWIWSDGSAMSFTSWWSGLQQQVDVGGKWGHLSTPGKGWGASLRSSTHGVVCKKPTHK